MNLGFRIPDIRGQFLGENHMLYTTPCMKLYKSFPELVVTDIPRLLKPDLKTVNMIPKFYDLFGAFFMSEVFQLRSYSLFCLLFHLSGYQFEFYTR
jgi:hypothetical protein